MCIAPAATPPSLCCHPPCNSSAGGVLTKIRVGCLNLRGLKSNSDYLKKILGRLDICGISEHWLYHYDLSLLSKAHSEFYACSTYSKPEEDGLRCTPRSLRGNGRVSILWHKTLQPYVQKLTDISTERVVGLSLQTAQSVFFLFICQLTPGVLTTSKNVWIIWMPCWVTLPLTMM